jgi:hypothetical protein
LQKSLKRAIFKFKYKFFLCFLLLFFCLKGGGKVALFKGKIKFYGLD